jgi:hypothetical protein
MAPDRAEVAELPPTCPIAFKEWAGVCAALLEGRQSLIVRKGGIAEGPRGFVPEHEAFWLYPTHVHQAQQGLRVATPPEAPEPAGIVILRALAVVDSIAMVTREESLAALGDLHVWTEATLAQRFHYRKPGLWVLGVRVFRRARPHAIEVIAEHAGCKTWVTLDPPLETGGCAPVLDASAYSRQRALLEAALA